MNDMFYLLCICFILLVVGYMYYKKICKLKIQNTNYSQKIAELEKKNIEQYYQIKFWEEQNKILNSNMKSIETLEELNAKNFENLSRKVIDENNKKFNDLAKEKIDNSLSPVKLQFDDLKQHIDALKLTQQEHTLSLKEQVNYVTRKADNLSNILTVDKKFQGSWGEFQLEKLLQLAGLIKDKDYFKEKYVDDENKDRIDVMVKLPDNKHIMIDSKVSLISYAKYLESTNSVDLQKKYLDELRNNIKHHINSLSAKAYNKSAIYPGLEYTIMFIPIENVYILSFEDINLYEYAWKHNIIPVAPSNLYATLRISASLIALEKRTTGILKIVDSAEKMLNRLQTVYEDIDKVSNQFNTAQGTLTKVKNSLLDGRGTVISHAKAMINEGQLNTKFRETVTKQTHNSLSKNIDKE